MSHGNQDILDRMWEVVQREKLSGLLTLSPENFAYATGFSVPSQEPLRWRHAMVAVAASGRTAVLCVDMEETTVRAKLPDAEVFVWQEFRHNAVEVLTTMLHDLGMDTGSLATELDYLPARDYEAVRVALPAVTLVPGDALLSKLRQRKTPREVAILKDLSRKTDRAVQTAFDSVHPGDTELQLSGAAIASLFANGVDRERGMVTASGDRSFLPNVRATERQMLQGDVIRLELFGVSAGYHSGVCRSGVVGSAAAEPERVWEVLADCRRIVLELMRPGVIASDVYRAYLERFSALGYEPISFVGHGIGVFMHEDPYLGAHDHTVLEEGMVFGVEPLLYLPGHFGLQIKDTVHIGPDGAEVLSDVMDATQLAVVR